jgi:hypothetical protein
MGKMLGAMERYHQERVDKAVVKGRILESYMGLEESDHTRKREIEAMSLARRIGAVPELADSIRAVQLGRSKADSARIVLTQEHIAERRRKEQIPLALARGVEIADAMEADAQNRRRQRGGGDSPGIARTVS